ncbi:MAG: hypothetical protein IJW39_04845 [Opitutales bacterium]|nr:hypothetical protein [Opitutales bacterium]
MFHERGFGNVFAMEIDGDFYAVRFFGNNKFARRETQCEAGDFGGAARKFAVD